MDKSNILKLKWTKEAPTEEGWYYLYQGPQCGNSEIVYVRRLKGFDNRLCAFNRAENLTLPISEYRFVLWAGPIPEPEGL